MLGRQGPPWPRNWVCVDFVSEPQKVLILPLCVMYIKKAFLYLLINLTLRPECLGLK